MKKYSDSFFKKPKRSIIISMLLMSLIPILTLGIIITFYAQHSVNYGMKLEVKNYLSGMAHTELSFFQTLHNDGITYENEKYISNGVDIYNDNYRVDLIKSASNVDVTIFVGDTRIQTSIINDKGERMIGTKASNEVVQKVLNSGSEYFDECVNIGNEKYFGYYIPIRDSKLNIVGMVFAGKPRAEVLNIVKKCSMRAITISLVITLLTCLISICISKKMVLELDKIMYYLGNISKGDFSQQMDKNVLKRRDEIGKIGRYSVTLADSLKDMITTDPLTSLLNRRSSILNIEKLTYNFNKSKTFTVAIADIDYFKSINDKYGHECGDMALMQLADILKFSVLQKGFAARWGGEEFLIVYEKTGIEKAQEYLCELLDKIRDKEFCYNDNIFHITITVGAKEYDGTMSAQNVIKSADDSLYAGKNSGRNKVIV